MVDVLHFLFEQDSRYTSGEEAEAVSKLRTMVYRNMYNKEYRYQYNSSRSNTGGRQYIRDNNNDFMDDGLSGFAETKPYIPPTQVRPESSMPFGDVLDAPIG